jgi:hypothetical protein
VCGGREIRWRRERGVSWGCQIGLNNNWNNNGSKTEKRDRGFTWFGL